MINQNKHKILFYLLGGIFLYLISTGVSMATFRYLSPPVSPDLISPVPIEEGKSKINLSGPKTESCPLNGQMFTKTEREIWEKRRPLAVMVENHKDSRPQSGLSRADVVYEAVAEGGITRFLAVYYCASSAEEVKLSPVRSTRVPFIYWASEYGKNPIYVHVGGANDYQHTGDTAKQARALEMLAEIGWRYKGGNDFDYTFDVGFPVFWRDYDRLDHPVATEHTVVSTTEKIWEEASKRGLTAVDKKTQRWDQGFNSWKFKDEAGPGKRGAISNIKIEFWDNQPDYDVEWQYNKEVNQYTRLSGGQPYKDLNNDEQLKAKTVIIQFCKQQGPVDRNKHILYTNTGSGKAIIFQDGQAIEGNWAKTDRQSRTKFTDIRGREIELNRGSVWIEIVPVGQTITY